MKDLPSDVGDELRHARTERTLSLDSAQLSTVGHRLLARAAHAILNRTWDPSQSTAQPPYVCAHERVQFATWRRVHVCCACGATR